MDNYQYIISSLPVIAEGYRFTDDTPESILAEIREQLSERDNLLVGFLLDGFDAEKLCDDFYRKALTHKDAFLSGYFRFDLNMRNAKVRYLNAELGRPEDKDVLDISQDREDEEGKVIKGVEAGEFEEEAAMSAALGSGDILSREKGIDALTWEKIDSLTTFDYFDVDAVLGFIAKLHIVARWFKLDEQTGREMFGKLVDEVRGTFKGVEYNE